MKKIYNRVILLVLLFGLHFSVFSQLVVNNTMTAAQLVQNVLLGPGISAFNITSSAAGTGVSIGQFTNGNTTNLGITSGVVMSTGSIFDIPNTGAGQASTDNGSGGDAQLDALASATIYDATWLQFDFIPTVPTVTFRYVFGSEEYPEFVNSGYNDVFGFFITGPNPGGGNYTNVNLALIPSTTLPVSIDNVNSGSYSQYYIDNASGATIVFDAFTSVLTATCQVTPCQTYHIKFAVGDAGDGIYDSGVFLEGGSFSGGNSVSTSFTTTNPTLSGDAIEGCTDAIVTFSLATPFSTATTINFTVGGSATNGVDYTMIPSSVTIPAGSTFTTLTIDPVLDALAEGTETVQLIVATPPCGFDTVLVNIANYTPLTITAPPDVAVCDGDQLVLTATITGGLGPYSYLWNNGTANATTTVYPTPSGSFQTYTVTVTDACNNQPSDNTVVTVNNCTSCNTSAGPNDKTCGLTYNPLQATTQPGDYNTFWSSAAPGVIFSNYQSPTSSVTVPSFGTYTFVWSVTSSSGDTCSRNVIIIFTPLPTSTFTVVNANCFGDDAVVTYTGSAPAGATYTWNFGGGVSTPGTGQGPHNVIYGSAGNFSIQLSVNDSGCVSNTTTQSVNNPPLLDLNIVAGSVTCANGTNGTVNVNVTGGIYPPLIYTWSNGPTPPTVAGTYTATVTDQHGCTDTNTFTITEPQAITITPFQTDLNCYNDFSGTAGISVSGGTLPYTYDWSNDTSLHTSSQSNMPAGLFVVAVTDSNGCLVNQTITIVQPTAITINSTNITDVSCNGTSTGSATVTANGGTFPLSYSLTGPLQNNGNFTALTAGNYTVTVIDANNCILTYPFEITEPSQVTLLSQTFTNITCFGLHNGTITASATGGTGTLNYSIGGASQIVGTFTNLYPGNYLVSVTDDNGCAVTGTPIIISQPPMLSIDSVGSTNLSCFGVNDGTATVIVSGGTAPLLYFAGTSVQTNGTYINIPAATYSVTITDANSCSVQTNPIIITQPPQLIITSQNATAIPCYGNPATVSVIATGGTNPLSYSLNGGFPTPVGVYTGLSGGTYSVTIRDNNNCTITSNTFVINEPPQLMVTDSSFTDITCNGYSNGTLSATATGGTPPLQYSITAGINQDINTFSGLDIGNYTLTITDDNGCKEYSSFTITEPTAMISTVSGTDVKCNGGSDGSASINTTGGTLPYEIFWSNGAMTTNVINLGVGIYFISVTDANNCSTFDTVIISQPTTPLITSSADTIICKNTQAIILANPSGGTQPYKFLWDNLPPSVMSTYTPTLSLNTAISVYIIDANNCFSDTANTFIGIIPDVTLDVFTPDDSVCVGTTVNIYATASGGDGGPYTVYNEQYDILYFPYPITPLFPHTYNFYAKDYTCPISGRDTINIFTQPLPTIEISADNYKGCQPFTVNFSVETNPECTDFMWDFGEQNAISYTKFPQHVYDNEGIYDVGITVTSVDGCTNSLTMQQLITVYPKPESRFDFDPEIVSILKPEIFFTNYSTDGTTNMWSFGDGDSSLAENPSHLYGHIGQYNVLLAVETGFGCKDTSVAKIVVKDEIAFYVPTAFSPDNDGINDVFKVKGHGIDLNSFLLNIYDRWGELIFTSTKLDEGWNGSVKKGARGTSDTYVWMVSFKDFNGKKYVKSGNVTLIR